MHAAAGDIASMFVFVHSISFPFFAAKSNLGWKLVGFMEQDPDLDRIGHGMDINDLRAKEKVLMQHDRACLGFSCLPLVLYSLAISLSSGDMLAACRIGSVGQGGGRGIRGSRGGQVKMEDGAGTSNPKKAKKQRPNLSNQTCYNYNGNLLLFEYLLVHILFF